MMILVLIIRVKMELHVYVMVSQVINATVQLVSVVNSATIHYQVRIDIEMIYNLLFFLSIECSDPDIVCTSAKCVDTSDPNLPVYCECYDGTRRDPRLNVTCPQSL